MHRPVLLREVVEWLAPPAGGRVLDGTVGSGGHARALLERMGPAGFLAGLDRDPEALNRARAALAESGARCRLSHGAFSDAPEILAGEPPFDAALLDLGVSNEQIMTPRRGFSFMREGPLDMRMDPGTRTTAADIVGRWRPEGLERLIREYGEDRFARRIAASIGRARKESPIRTTTALAEIVRRAIPSPRGRIDPATRTFQALRIEVNNELGELEAGLPAVFGLLAGGGRLAVLSYHSLEDRIVKVFCRGLEARGKCVALAKKPVRPSEAEVAENPMARSAKMRVLQKT